MLMSDAVTEARGVLNDTRATSYRYSDTDLVKYGNDALDALALIKPSLFYDFYQHTCTAGSMQVISDPDSLGVVDVLMVIGGNALTKQNMLSMTLDNPGWISAVEGAAIHWLPYGNDDLRFFLYPPAPEGQVVGVLQKKSPPELALSDTIPVAPSYFPLIVDYIVGMASARDDESVNSGRMAAFMKLFADAAAISKGA